MSCHTAERVERNPLGAPDESNGELAKHALRTGPRSCTRCHRSFAIAGAPASRFTWIDAVWRIIVRPAGQWESKYSSMAR